LPDVGCTGQDERQENPTNHNQQQKIEQELVPRGRRRNTIAISAAKKVRHVLARIEPPHLPGTALTRSAREPEVMNSGLSLQARKGRIAALASRAGEGPRYCAVTAFQKI